MKKILKDFAKVVLSGADHPRAAELDKLATGGVGEDQKAHGFTAIIGDANELMRQDTSGDRCCTQRSDRGLVHRGGLRACSVKWHAGEH